MSLKHITFMDIWEKLGEVKKLEHAKTDTLYMEMHAETLRDLMLDPDMDRYITTSPSIITAETVGMALGARIFLHTDSSKRNMITIVYRADVLIGEEDNEIKIPKGNMR